MYYSAPVSQVYGKFSSGLLTQTGSIIFPSVTSPGLPFLQNSCLRLAQSTMKRATELLFSPHVI